MSDQDEFRLRAFQEDDLAMLSVWWAHEDVIHTQSDWPVPRPPEVVSEIFRAWGNNDPAGSSHALAVDVDGVLAGYVAIFGFQFPARTGECAVMIGPTHQGKGTGRRAMLALLAVAFDDLDLHKVEVRVFAFNTRALRLYHSLGFVEEGRLRDRVLHAGQRHEEIVMGMLHSEWKRTGRSTP